jgi:hypothetical protein
MREEIIERMTEIVNETMTSFQSDFYHYDKPTIENESALFPMIWGIAPTHTFLLKLGDFRDIFFDSEYARYAYAYDGDDGMTWRLQLSNYAKDQLYLITEDGIRPITRENALNAIKDYVTPAVVEWIQKNGPLPKPKMVVKLHGITFSELKGLIQECRDHNDDSLLSRLKEFKQYRQRAKNHVIDVYWNAAWHEFSFAESVNGQDAMVGGIIFHGWPETGYKENYSVMLNPAYGWTIHT